MRRVIPPLLNDFIGLQKDTALVGLLGVVEAFRQSTIESSATFNFTPYLVTAILFVLLTIPLARLTDWLVARDRRRQLAAGGLTVTDAPALLLEGVHKSFGKHEVLKGIDLELAAHEVVCLIGASGSGKSTLLRCVNLLEPIDEGRVVLGGDEITAPGVDLNRVRRRVGIVFQAFNLFPHMTVLRNVTLGPTQALGRPRAEAEAEALELLGRFGLADRAADYPDRLSGGQQQRVAIVRALAMQPELMLLDEVTSALDPELVAEVLSVIRELAEGGMTMLIATHEMSFARDIAVRVCFLDEGVILEQGDPEQIFTAPREPRTQQFLQRIVAAGRALGNQLAANLEEPAIVARAPEARVGRRRRKLPAVGHPGAPVGKHDLDPFDVAKAEARAATGRALAVRHEPARAGRAVGLDDDQRRRGAVLGQAGGHPEPRVGRQLSARLEGDEARRQMVDPPGLPAGVRPSARPTLNVLDSGGVG